MLPFLRILPVGGVLLAILILVLALSPPDGSRSPLTAAIAPARGALVDRERHPEVRQFLILAALKRADELDRLRQLPDATRSDDVQGAFKVADLPGARSDAESDETGSVNELPAANIPIEVGEPSSTELPVTTQEESRPAVKPPEPAKARHRAVHRPRRTRTTSAPPQFGLFDIFFGGQQSQSRASSTKQVAQPYGASQANQTLRGYQGGQSYGTNQWDEPYGTKQATQSAASYTNPAPQIDPY